MEHVLKILESMNEDEIKPNIQTLNALLKMIIELKIDNFKDVIKYLIIEFKNMNIKFSLGTYYYIMLGFTIYGNYILFIICFNFLFIKLYFLTDHNSYDNFIHILYTVKNKKFTIQDSADTKFFKHAMYLAHKYNNKEAGNMIHEILLKEDNYKFISTAIIVRFI